MINETDMIEPYITDLQGFDINSKTKMLINDDVLLFSLRPSKVERTIKNTKFLKNLKKLNSNENITDENGSGVYYFKYDNCIIELDVSIEEQISIIPYLYVDYDKIKNEIIKLTEMDYLLFSVLKKNGLQ